MVSNTDESGAYEQWLNNLDLDDVLTIFRDHQAEQLYCKILQPNNNSKQQIYVRSDISELSWVPTGELTSFKSSSKKDRDHEGVIFHAPITFLWITPSGELEPAKDAKLIVYPQYPEVRLSGFLKGTRQAPSFLLNHNHRGHDPGRLLFLAPRVDGTLLALCVPPESIAAREVKTANFEEKLGVFFKVPLDGETGRSSLNLLLAELCRVHRLGWTPSCALNARGVVPCNSSNCGGYTLEANLGIRRNGISEPDFQGWEIKSRIVKDIKRPCATQVTLFTPEPDGGYYREAGAASFVRRWGYEDTKGREDRLNFGGVYKCGGPIHGMTGTRLILDGYDPTQRSMASEGALRLIDTKGVEAASWSFGKLLGHWKRKHAHTAYVACECHPQPTREYRYSDDVVLGEGADFRRFMAALANGTIAYDPGIKLEHASSTKPKLKVRSQLRVSSNKLQVLYASMRTVSVCTK